MSDNWNQTRTLLQSAIDGSPDAAEQLLPVVYDELHRLAERMMRSEQIAHTLQPTALINEAFLRLAGSENADWEGRAHFVRVAARAMRHVLVDHARRKRSDKRGGGQRAATLDEANFAAAAQADELLAVNEALDGLAEADPQLGQIVEMRLFAGLTHEEIAKTMDVSVRTVERGWRTARAWLIREMGD